MADIPGLKAQVRRLLDSLEREDTASSPTLGELWPSYWATEGQHLTSKDRTRIAWNAMADVCGRDGLALRERQAMTISADTVEELRGELHKREGRKPGELVRPATVNRMLIVLRRLLNWAVEQRKIPHCPLRVKLERENNVQKTAIRSEADFQRLLAACQDPRDRALALLLFDGGLRCEEGIKLQRHQVDVKPDGGAHVHLFETKTNQVRVVCLTRRTAEALEALPRRGPYYFANPDTGRPYSKRYLYERYRRVVAASGLEPAPGESIGWHTLRHSLCYIRRARDHWPASRIMAQTGHKTDIAFRRYGIVDTQETDDAMDLVELRIVKEASAVQMSLFPTENEKKRS